MLGGELARESEDRDFHELMNFSCMSSGWAEQSVAAPLCAPAVKAI